MLSDLGEGLMDVVVVLLLCVLVIIGLSGGLITCAVLGLLWLAIIVMDKLKAGACD